MSYSIDRSARTRGAGAIAARDLSEGRGGVVVRTGRGPVTLVRKAALGATEHHQDGGRGQKPKPRFPPFKVAVRKPTIATGWIGSARGYGTKPPAKKKPIVVVLPSKPRGFWRPPLKGAMKRTAGGTSPSSVPTTVSTAPRPAPAVSTFGGGGGGGGGAFTPDSAGVSWGPDEFAQASEQEIRDQEEAAAAASMGPDAAQASQEPGAPSDETAPQDAAVPGVPGTLKKPMSTGTKIAVAAGIGYLLFSMWKGH